MDDFPAKTSIYGWELPLQTVSHKQMVSVQMELIECHRFSALPWIRHREGVQPHQRDERKQGNPTPNWLMVRKNPNVARIYMSILESG